MMKFLFIGNRALIWRNGGRLDLLSQRSVENPAVVFYHEEAVFTPILLYSYFDFARTSQLRKRDELGCASQTIS